jgi:hypothetical protein
MNRAKDRNLSSRQNVERTIMTAEKHYNYSTSVFRKLLAEHFRGVHQSIVAVPAQPGKGNTVSNFQAP